MELEESLRTLNEYQKEAVEDESRACLVKANVGSGKTTVLVTKLQYLHVYKKVPYERMIVLTFTNKAADEIRDRLCARRETGEENMADLSGFGTFHSVALRLLRDRLPVERLGYRRDFTVIEPEEEADMALALIVAHGLTIKYKNRLKKRLEQEKGNWQQGRGKSRYQDDLFRLFALLEQEKVRQNKFSFSDLISVSIQLLKDSGLQPDWIIVDEVQDSDRQQLDFISALMGEHTRLFAVGDPNQVIYSWRGSEENIFFLLSHRFQARELTLPVNYRSSDSILAAARCFQQGGERLMGARGAGEKIHVKDHYDPFQEAEYLAERIAGLHREGIAWQDIAVFYRLQSQSEQLEKVFDRYGIPFSVSVKKTLADLPALSWLVKVLRFSCNPQDTFIGEEVRRNSWYTMPGLEERIRQFPAWVLGTNACLLRPQDLYDYFDLDSALKPSSASFARDRELVLDFLEQILEYARWEGLSLLDGMRTFLNSAALYGVNLFGKEAVGQKDAVRLMTLHASKGLEFRCVFIIGVNYGLIPLQSKSWEEEEEERRLFFVGMTRAKDYLELSWYTNPAQPRAVAGPGKYLEMIPEHLLIREDRKKKGAADLAQLRRAVLEAKRQKEAAEKAETVEKTETAETAEKAEITEGAESMGKAADKEYRAISAQETAFTEAPCAREVEHKPPNSKRQVRHARYGTGTVEYEDDTKIAVDFENYGKKEFIKAFTKLEEVTGCSGKTLHSIGKDRI